MADILADLYDGYAASLAANMVDGGDLSWLKYAAPVGEIDWATIWGYLPGLVYFWRETPFEADSMEGTCRSDKKFYNFEMNCIFEMQFSSNGTSCPQIPKTREHIAHAATIETLYNRNNLDISAKCWMTRMWAGAPTYPGFTMDGIRWIYGINFSFVHLWQDRRYT